MSRPGFVYAIRCVADGWIKVGMTKSPNDRLRKLRHQEGGIALRMVRTWPVRNARKAEIAAHDALAGFPRRGEWFNASERDVVNNVDAVIALLLGKRPAAQKKREVDTYREQKRQEARERIATHVGTPASNWLDDVTEDGK